jgi:hypothetical protein
LPHRQPSLSLTSNTSRRRISNDSSWALDPFLAVTARCDALSAELETLYDRVEKLCEKLDDPSLRNHPKYQEGVDRYDLLTRRAMNLTRELDGMQHELAKTMSFVPRSQVEGILSDDENLARWGARRFLEGREAPKCSERLRQTKRETDRALENWRAWSRWTPS